MYMSTLIFQNAIAMHKNDVIDIIIAQVLSDIKLVSEHRIFQNAIAMHKNNVIDIIVALVLSDIKLVSKTGHFHIDISECYCNA